MGGIEVLDAAVNWRDGYENAPDLTFLLNRIPTFGPYDKRPMPDGENFYWTESEGFATFFVWSGRPDNGFGGARRTVQINDGTEEEIVGGWSSRGEIAETVGYPATVPVATRTDYIEIRGERILGGGIGLHMLHDRFRAEVERLLPDVEVIEANYGTLTVKWRGQIPKWRFMEDEHLRTDAIRETLRAEYGNDWYRKATEVEREELAIRPYSALGVADAVRA